MFYLTMACQHTMICISRSLWWLPGFRRILSWLVSFGLDIQIPAIMCVFASLFRKPLTNEEENSQLGGRLHAILDSTVDGIITINERGVIESYNKACAKMFGYSLEEVIGQNIKMLMPEPYHGEHDQYLQNYHETGHRRVIGIGRDVAGRHKNGSVFPIELSVSEVSVSGKKIFSGIMRDVSERKTADEALRVSESRLRALVDNTVDGLITIDEIGVIEQFNKSCERIFGYAAEEVIGRNVKILMPQEYAEPHDGYLRNYMSTGEAKIIGIGREVKAMRKDGTVFPIDLSVAEVREQNGIRFFSGIIRDITARKQAEEEIFRSNTELERFAYVASHDLQEPLRMVSNFTELLDKEYSSGMDSTAQEYMRFIISAARRMQDLVDDLLEYSRIGHSEEKMLLFHTGDVVTTAVDNLSALIQSSHAEISYDDFPELYGSPMLFARLLQNLVGNALKYRAPDRVPKIHIGCKIQDDSFVFSVKDNGIGIKSVYFQQVFVLFKRLHGRNEYSGTGIGLPICKKIVESMGGKIWVNSEFGKGSTFYFTIPKVTLLKEVA